MIAKRAEKSGKFAMSTKIDKRNLTFHSIHDAREKEEIMMLLIILEPLKSDIEGINLKYSNFHLFTGESFCK
jgi:hypothetical protein